MSDVFLGTLHVGDEIREINNVSVVRSKIHADAALQVLNTRTDHHSLPTIHGKMSEKQWSRIQIDH